VLAKHPFIPGSPLIVKGPPVLYPAEMPLKSGSKLDDPAIAIATATSRRRGVKVTY